MKVDTGIPSEQRKQIAEGLARVLADTYTLYLKTHNFHWNVTGPLFPSLHALFEEQYRELAEATDTVAERIRALGHPAPGSYAQFGRLTSIHEAEGVPAAEDMVRELAMAHETAAKTARSVFPVAKSGDDEATVDLLTQRMAVHEKAAWMLRSTVS